MAISETARKNHDELFPGYVSTLAVTDPELTEIFDNFAFDQAVPCAGMGKVFDFLHATNDVLTGRGVQLPLGGQATTTPDTRARTGRTVQEQIAGTERVKPRRLRRR